MSKLFHSKADVWVNTVNCVGVMGAGVAKEFARHFPHIVEPYQDACLRGEMYPGAVFPIKTVFDAPSVILCAATKDHYSRKSQMEWIDDCLDGIAAWMVKNKRTSLAIPALGCGNGGLDWNLVEPKIYATLGFLGKGLEVYRPWSF